MEDLSELVLSTSNRIYALRERLLETLRQDFPSETPELLGNMLLQLVDKVSDELTRVCSELPASPPERRTLARRVRLYACSIRNLARYLRYVEGARLEHNPWHIVGQFERLCRRIVPRARVIIRPKWKYNYESRWLNPELESQVLLLRHDLKPIFDLFPNFFVLSYTSAESEDLLQYAIWGHEIGHLYYQELGARKSRALNEFSQAIARAAPFDPAAIDDLLDFRFRHRLGIDPDDIQGEERAKHKDLLVTGLAGARNSWLSEFFADLFAARLLGPASLLAFSALPLTEDELHRSTPSHPSPRIRLAEMLKQIERLEYTTFLGDAELVSEREATAQIEREVKASWKTWHEGLERRLSGEARLQGRGPASRLDPAAEEWRLQERFLIENVTQELPVVVEMVNEKITGEYSCSPEDMRNVFHQVELLHHSLPPDIKGSDPRCLGLILTAGWLYWITYGKAAYEVSRSYEEIFERRKKVNRLLSKGIESTTVQAAFVERKRYAPSTRALQASLQEAGPATTVSGGILSAPDLLVRMNEPSMEKRLCIMPLLERDQIQADSVDLRLGNSFLVTRRTSSPVIDVAAGRDEFRERIEQYQRRIYVPIGRPFYVHPGQFVLASSFEFLSMPEDLAGSLVGRTSWGRLGISVPTTSKVAPGFKGCLTIEIKNLGEAPVPLYPGVRIAQLRVYTLSRKAVYHGRYEVPTTTEFSRIEEDPEMAFLGERQPSLMIGVTGLSKSGRSRVVNHLRDEGFQSQSLAALQRHEMRRSGCSETEEEEREFVAEYRRSRGCEIFAELLLDRLDRISSDKIVVEGIERVEEIELLRGCTRFFLIHIEAPFEHRLEWAQDYAEEPYSEERLRQSDAWEMDGISAQGQGSVAGAPNLRACVEEADYHIRNERGKAYLHQQLEAILHDIREEENLYLLSIL